MATGSEANVGHPYREARDYLDNAPDTEEVMRALDSTARAYRDIYTDDLAEDPSPVLSYRRIRVLDITTAVPLLAWLLTLAESGLSQTEHVTCVRAVESWAPRRAFVGWQTRGYGTHLTRVLREAKLAVDKEMSVSEAVVTGLRGGVLDWPTDGDSEEAFAQKKFYGAMSAARLRLLLGAINARLRSENPNEPSAVIDYEDPQIEHVMPQSWQDHWPVVQGSGDLAQREVERTRVVDRVGNLTLVTGTFNRSVSNLAWSVKRPEFENQRSLVFNYEIASSADWDESSINTRSKTLAAAACRVWPSAEALLD